MFILASNHSVLHDRIELHKINGMWIPRPVSVEQGKWIDPIPSD